MKRTLVLGKFYPPHKGHHYLIQQALQHSEHVIILCLGSIKDTYTPQQRITALKEDLSALNVDNNRITFVHGYDETPHDENNNEIWNSHIEIFKTYLRQLPPIDTVATSEDYGIELAKRLGVSHYEVDKKRNNIPMSSTAFRENPIEFWHMLGDGGKRMLTSRIVVLGAESTGTTTIAEKLTEKLKQQGGVWTETKCVPEYGHELTFMKQETERKNYSDNNISVEWTRKDFLDVVVEQNRREEHAITNTGPVLICDTDSFATPVWEKRYLGEPLISDNRNSLGVGDLYLLTSHIDVPFIQDGSRDGEHMRAEMTRMFEDRLALKNKPWIVLTGSIEQRLELAEKVTLDTVTKKLHFSQPI